MRPVCKGLVNSPTSRYPGGPHPLPDLATAHARQGFRRVRRGLGRTCLTSRALTPRLVPVVLRLVAGGEVPLVLDSHRCGRWEVFTLGVRWGGRVLPVALTPDPSP